jgi:hypothetical protein
MVAPILQTEDNDPDTPRSSVSEPRSAPQHDDSSSPPTSIEIERPKSASDELLKEHHNAWYPRRLSFSTAQDAVETWYT